MTEALNSISTLEFLKESALASRDPKASLVLLKAHARLKKDIEGLFVEKQKEHLSARLGITVKRLPRVVQ